MLRDTPLYPNNESQVMNLLRGCDKLRYSTVIGRSLYEKVEDNVTIATWTTLFQRFDTEFAKVLEDKLKRDRTYTVMTIRQEIDSDRPVPKAKVVSFSRKDVSKAICHNCLEAGHYSRTCTKPASTCSFCNKTGHRIEVCRERVRLDQDVGHAKTNGKTKGKAHKASSSLTKPEPNPAVAYLVD